jgi:hypothetical protein
MRKFENKLDWESISHFIHLPNELILEFRKNIDWMELFSQHNIDFDIMKKFINKTQFENIEEFNTEHLSEDQKNRIQKILDIKYLFTTQKTY